MKCAGTSILHKSLGSVAMLPGQIINMSLVLLQVSNLAQATRKLGQLRTRTENLNVRPAEQVEKAAMASVTTDTERIREEAGPNPEGTRDMLW